jgi:hypothetical protein
MDAFAAWSSTVGTLVAIATTLYLLRQSSRIAANYARTGCATGAFRTTA